MADRRRGGDAHGEDAETIRAVRHTTTPLERTVTWTLTKELVRAGAYRSFFASPTIEAVNRATRRGELSVTRLSVAYRNASILMMVVDVRVAKRVPAKRTFWFGRRTNPSHEYKVLENVLWNLPSPLAIRGAGDKL